jgi:hypothetical protein
LAIAHAAERLSFSKIPDFLQLPDLITVQKESWSSQAGDAKRQVR